MYEFNWWEILKGCLIFVNVILIPYLLKLIKGVEKKIDVVEQHTNGMKTELVNTTKTLGEAVGFAKGVAEEKKKTEVKT